MINLSLECVSVVLKSRVTLTVKKCSMEAVLGEKVLNLLARHVLTVVIWRQRMLTSEIGKAGDFLSINHVNEKLLERVSLLNRFVEEMVDKNQIPIKGKQ